jgi:hypothetical protein
MHSATKDALLALQLFHVLFLSLHDWVPLLNDVKAVRAAIPCRRLLTTTLVSVIPYAFGVVASAIYLRRPYPAWLPEWLWVSYAVLFVGELRAWWSISAHSGARARCTPSGHVRPHTRLPARAQRHQAQYAARDSACSDAHHIGRAGCTDHSS